VKEEEEDNFGIEIDNKNELLGITIVTCNILISVTYYID
jgi:hypothetical protein